MNEKIFTLLKQSYSSLGLGDALLKAIAEGLAASATEENVESLVAAQKPILEAMQKANDKRAADAAAKAKADADAAAKAAKEAEDKKAAEFARQIEELQKQLKAKEPTPPTPPTPPVPPKEDKIPDYFLEEQKKRAEQDKQTAETMKALLESVNALKDENAKFKAAKAAEERASFITKTARELGVPEWREKEGFNITDAMSEDDIKTYLSGVANNIRTNVTAQNHFGVPNISEDKKVVEEQTKKLAADMVSQL